MIVHPANDTIITAGRDTQPLSCFFATPVFHTYFQTILGRIFEARIEQACLRRSVRSLGNDVTRSDGQSRFTEDLEMVRLLK
jgi:hypothetical protein